MRFLHKSDKSIIVFNEFITIEGIPLETYSYIVNGRPAIEWVMERHSLTLDKNSKIENNPNDWSIDGEKDSKYILKLLQRVITVSLETNKIANSLPLLIFD